MPGVLRHRIAALIPKGPIASSIMSLAGGTAAAQIITACAMPIVTRLYTPAQIGVISLFLAFFSFWTALLSWRYESALLIAADDAESHLIFRVGSGCVMLMSLLGLPVLMLFIAGNALGFGLLPWWSAWAAVPILMGYGQFMMYRSWGLRGGYVRDISKATVTRSASNAGGRVVLGLLGAGIPGLFAAELLGAWGAMGALYRTVHRRFEPSRPLFRWSALMQVMQRYSKFAKYEMPSVALDKLSLTLPVPMVAALYGPAAAGWFGLAKLLVAIPNAQIGAAVADVFQMELARAVREREYTAAKQLFYKLLRKLSLLGLLPLAGTMLLGPWLVPLIFGKSWEQMGVIVVCIAPWIYAALVVSTLSRLLSVFQEQKIKLVYDIFTLLLVLAIYYLSRWLGFDLVAMVSLLSAANVVAYGLYLLILKNVIERRACTSGIQ